MINVIKKNFNIDLIEVNTEWLQITLLNHGARIYSLSIPDIDNNLENVVLTFKDLDDYLGENHHLNATIGPTSGRIENAEFKINETTYRLDKNDNDNNLHGGEAALSKVIFDYDIEKLEGKTIIEFTTTKIENMYPGIQKYKITYTITSHEVKIDYCATTTKPTLVNLTNHTYFNLSGDLKRDILDQEIMLNASNRLELDHVFIPIYKKDIMNTPYDFRKMHSIKGDDIIELDNPYLLDEINSKIIQASLYDNISKRRLDVYTTYSTIVCYTQNFPIYNQYVHGIHQEKHMGVCFEAQNHPNGINMEGYETSILKPNEKYQHQTRFVFSIDE